MLTLETEERNELLESFRGVMGYLQRERDDKIMASLMLLDEHKLDAALKLMDETNKIEALLTDLKSLLESEYKQCVRLQ